MGLGGGTILIIYFVSFLKINQIKAQSISLLFIIPTAITSIIIYFKKKILKFNLIFKISVPGIIGAMIGIIFLKNINLFILKKMLSIFLFIMGFFIFFNNKKNKS